MKAWAGSPASLVITIISGKQVSFHNTSFYCLRSMKCKSPFLYINNKKAWENTFCWTNFIKVWLKKTLQRLYFPELEGHGTDLCCLKPVTIWCTDAAHSQRTAHSKHQFVQFRSETKSKNLSMMSRVQHNPHAELLLFLDEGWMSLL